jgi:hypothetical protein
MKVNVLRAQLRNAVFMETRLADQTISFLFGIQQRAVISLYPE